MAYKMKGMSFKDESSMEASPYKGIFGRLGKGLKKAVNSTPIAMGVRALKGEDPMSNTLLSKDKAEKNSGSLDEHINEHHGGEGEGEGENRGDASEVASRARKASLRGLSDAQSGNKARIRGAVAGGGPMFVPGAFVKKKKY